MRAPAPFCTWSLCESHVGDCWYLLDSESWSIGSPDDHTSFRTGPIIFKYMVADIGSWHSCQSYIPCPSCVQAHHCERIPLDTACPLASSSAAYTEETSLPFGGLPQNMILRASRISFGNKAVQPDPATLLAHKLQTRIRPDACCEGTAKTKKEHNYVATAH